MVVTAAKILFVNQLAMPYLFSALLIRKTSHSLLILMVNILKPKGFSILTPWAQRFGKTNYSKLWRWFGRTFSLTTWGHIYLNRILTTSSRAWDSQMFKKNLFEKYFLAMALFFVQETLMKTWILNMAMRLKFFLAVEQHYITSSGTLVGGNHTDARLNFKNIKWIFICFLPGK